MIPVQRAVYMILGGILSILSIKIDIHLKFKVYSFFFAISIENIITFWKRKKNEGTYKEEFEEGSKKDVRKLQTNSPRGERIGVCG